MTDQQAPRTQAQRNLAALEAYATERSGVRVVKGSHVEVTPLAKDKPESQGKSGQS